MHSTEIQKIIELLKEPFLFKKYNLEIIKRQDDLPQHYTHKCDKKGIRSTEDPIRMNIILNIDNFFNEHSCNEVFEVFIWVDDSKTHIYFSCCNVLWVVKQKTSNTYVLISAFAPDSWKREKILRKNKYNQSYKNCYEIRVFLLP